MKIVFYENQSISRLYPIAYTRPAFDIFCGAATLYQVVAEIFKAPIDYFVRPEILNTTAKKFPANKSFSENILYLDASLIPAFNSALELLSLIKEKKQCLIKNQDKIIGFYASEPGLEIATLIKTEFKSVENGFESVNINWPIMNYCWETIIFNQKILHANLTYLKNQYQEFKPGVFVGQDVTLPENAVFETSEGIIIIDDYTKILPFTYLAGPIYIGKNCLIKEFASIKSNCCFGSVCKVGGEVEATIIQGYANKQHYGFLGHSYLGEWINIAAGTSNSDLKNTYSNIRIGGVETGQQFLGTVIGDFSRTAINTSIFTGRIIGVSSFVYGTITRDIVSFSNYAAHLGCVIVLDLPVAIKAQQSMFARRSREQTTVDTDLLAQVFEATREERNKQDICPGKLEFKI
ncbi:MAG: putative sugar nucleotidyl transferase [Candidatus Buchananbacteria bacterium]